MDWKRRLELWRKKSRGRTSDEKRDDCVQLRVRLAGRKIRRRGGTGMPTSNQPPRGIQGRRLCSGVGCLPADDARFGRAAACAGGAAAARADGWIWQEASGKTLNMRKSSIYSLYR